MQCNQKTISQFQQNPICLYNVFMSQSSIYLISSPLTTLKTSSFQETLLITGIRNCWSAQVAPEKPSKSSISTIWKWFIRFGPTSVRQEVSSIATQHDSRLPKETIQSLQALQPLIHWGSLRNWKMITGQSDILNRLISRLKLTHWINIYLFIRTLETGKLYGTIAFTFETPLEN